MPRQPCVFCSCADLTAARCPGPRPPPDLRMESQPGRELSRQIPAVRYASTSAGTSRSANSAADGTFCATSESTASRTASTSAGADTRTRLPNGENHRSADAAFADPRRGVRPLVIARNVRSMCRTIAAAAESPRQPVRTRTCWCSCPISPETSLSLSGGRPAVFRGWPQRVRGPWLRRFRRCSPVRQDSRVIGPAGFPQRRRSTGAVACPEPAVLASALLRPGTLLRSAGERTHLSDRARPP